jgi:hypothetical protein
MIGDSSGSFEHADDFRLVVGDCEFTERSRTSANDNHASHVWIFSTSRPVKPMPV